MTDNIRLKTILTKLNISLKRVISFLKSKKIKLDKNPNIKINNNIYKLLIKKFKSDQEIRNASEKIIIKNKQKKKKIKEEIDKKNNIIFAKAKKLEDIKTFGKIDLKNINKTIITKKNNINSKKDYKKIPKHITTKYKKIHGLKFIGKKIDLSKFEKNKISNKNIKNNKIKTTKINYKHYKNTKLKKNNKIPKKTIITNIEIDRQIKKTLEKIKQNKLKTKFLKLKKEKKQIRKDKENRINKIKNIENKTIKITEFTTVNELAAIMKIHENKVILTCISLGIMATMNQRLDAETITIIADEFGYKVDFIKLEEDNEVEIQNKQDLIIRPPVVIVMGHVDHGKTSLIDYIRKSNLTAKEAGKITQHIGAYNINIKNKNLTLLDTPGHEAFSSMRSRGVRITDIAIIVIDSTSKIMPQTKEAINHSKLAGVSMIFAINKIDLANSKPEKIREELANTNILVEEWGGKYQSQNISTKTGEGIEELLDKIMLEAEILNLKANPKKLGKGIVIEATLDKGRGYITNILIQEGSIKCGDYIVAGSNYGKIKSILDENGKNIKKTHLSQSVIILGLNGAPAAGDVFKIYKDEKEGKKIAIKRYQIKREQTIRSQRHLTLEEIGRRITIGDFKEIKIIIKGDVDGSIEALSDALQKLSSDNISVNIINKSVGQIIESDVLLATVSKSIIIGFNVKPSLNVKKIADKEKIKIYTFNIIYDAINKIKQIIKNKLTPENKEKVIGNAEIREIFISNKINNIYGCIVHEGKIIRNHKIKIIRNKKIIHTSKIKSLKRFKEDVKEINKGYECGVSIKNYNEAKKGDILECYELVK